MHPSKKGSKKVRKRLRTLYQSGEIIALVNDLITFLKIGRLKNYWEKVNASVGSLLKKIEKFYFASCQCHSLFAFPPALLISGS